MPEEVLLNCKDVPTHTEEVTREHCGGGETQDDETRTLLHVEQVDRRGASGVCRVTWSSVTRPPTAASV